MSIQHLDVYSDWAGLQMPATWRINSDFCLLSELKSLRFHLSYTQRVALMSRRFRMKRTFGVMENKLLAHSLLRELNVSTPDIYYGAFSHEAMGDWPRYSSATLARVLSKVEPSRWVLKTISGGQQHGSLHGKQLLTLKSSHD